jgi:Tfp pilus assembly protein PilN
MSLDFLTRPIGGGKPADGDPPRERRRGRPAPHPEDVRRPGSLAIGGEPRVDLMPPEVRVKRAQLRTRRSLRLGLVAVGAVVVVACGGTVAWSTLAAVNLTAAQSEATGLLQQQSGFSDVKNAIQSIQLIQAGQQVGASTEIDWQAYLDKVAGTLPGGVVIATASIDQATPVEPYKEERVPLQGDHVATLAISTRSADIPPIPAILASMEGLPGFVDVTPSDVSYQQDTQSYVASITLRIDTDAFDGRFQPKPSSGASDGGE